MKRMTGLNLRGIVALAVIAVGVGPALAAAPAAAQSPAAATPAAEARVTVTYVNPEKFSEAREFGQQDSYNDADYLKSLKSHLIKRAMRMLPPDDRLEVSITDIKLAGGYEPWHGPNFRYVRFMKDVYPPRIDLTFQLVDGNGKVLREGSRKLRNLGYLQSGVAMPTDTDPLRYDKALIDDWLRRGPEKL
ncbi:DUF3016 domain-containing protein [Rhodanobacter sp. B05]|uniref:DUF3016 domain-containing protein n=1 Tax=Rhodanobacter sp. B05 TaxID=1945859 RepID=UPI0020C3027C|nr:DUF3016 domain-containing protein [Rhodanobacter sp. B05]